MKSRPILFSAPMVRALLDGSKTQTRRAVKGTALKWLKTTIGFTPEFVADPANSLCPYGQRGDQLWVREAWRTYKSYDHQPPRILACTSRIVYEADARPEIVQDALTGKLRPSMFMPRWASRITLEITGVRVERLRDISRGDAMAEGCPFPNMAQGADPRKWYADLWNSINGPDTWTTNPWVWAVEFKRAAQ